MEDGMQKKLDGGLPAPEKGDLQLKKRQALISLPMRNGETRFCMFPFQKPSIFEDYFSLCCASALRAYPEPWQHFVDGSIAPAWCGDYMVRLREALLVGDHKNMIPACIHCERAPSVSPKTMQLHIALHSNTYKACPEALNVCGKLKDHYPEYQEELRSIGVVPYKYPEQDKEAAS